MIDGIDSYKGHEITWAVGTVIENAEGVGLENFNGGKEMVAAGECELRLDNQYST